METTRIKAPNSKEKEKRSKKKAISSRKSRRATGEESVDKRNRKNNFSSDSQLLKKAKATYVTRTWNIGTLQSRLKIFADENPGSLNRIVEAVQDLNVLKEAVLRSVHQWVESVLKYTNANEKRRLLNGILQPPGDYSSGGQSFWRSCIDFIRNRSFNRSAKHYSGIAFAAQMFGFVLEVTDVFSDNQREVWLKAMHQKEEAANWPNHAFLDVNLIAGYNFQHLNQAAIMELASDIDVACSGLFKANFLNLKPL